MDGKADIDIASLMVRVSPADARFQVFPEFFRGDAVTCKEEGSEEEARETDPAEGSDVEAVQGNRVFPKLNNAPMHRVDLDA